ncbi:MAG: hypothetical protein A2341_17055 [Deltaproteobacteria bacterium RIFOXYB12_FULL_58_9]|nr:MAG: hypothetical protein A2341_17055 [Deltaproteobacteria bacterium RIFOXYB12_FULL_58_9]
MPKAHSPQDSGANLGHLRQEALNFRHIPRGEKTTADGGRVVWHRGPRRSEMLSWVTKSGEVDKQELIFWGLVVSYDQRRHLRTGRTQMLQEQNAPSVGAGDDISWDGTLNFTTLDAASEFLKYTPEKDPFCRHLRKHINLSMASCGGFESERTIMLGTEQLTRPKRGTVDEPEKSARGKVPWIVAIVAAIAISAGTFFVLTRW